MSDEGVFACNALEQRVSGSCGNRFGVVEVPSLSEVAVALASLTLASVPEEKSAYGNVRAEDVEHLVDYVLGSLDRDVLVAVEEQHGRDIKLDALLRDFHRTAMGVINILINTCALIRREGRPEVVKDLRRCLPRVRLVVPSRCVPPM